MTMHVTESRAEVGSKVVSIGRLSFQFTAIGGFGSPRPLPSSRQCRVNSLR